MFVTVGLFPGQLLRHRLIGQLLRLFPLCQVLFLLRGQVTLQPNDFRKAGSDLGPGKANLFTVLFPPADALAIKGFFAVGSARNRVGAAAGAIFSLEKIRLLSGCVRLCEERMDAQLASYSKPAAGQRGIQFVIRNKGCWLGHLGEQRIVFPPWKSQFAKRLCNLLRAVIMIAQKRTVMGIGGRKLFHLFGERR